MKRFTDLFIARPVLAIAVSVLILVMGLRAVGTLPVQQFPETENATITITTNKSWSPRLIPIGGGSVHGHATVDTQRVNP